MNKSMVSVAFATAVMAGIALGSNSASATALYDDLSATSSGVDGASVSGQLYSFGPLYDSFSTGASGFSLDNFNLLIDADNPSDGGTFFVRVLTDNSTSPGTTIYRSGNFNDSVLSSSLNVVGFSFAPLTLAANTRYWIELSSTGSVNWSWSFDTSGPGVAKQYFFNQSGLYANSDGPYQMQIGTDVGTTPLPATLPLFATGLGAMGLLGWRRKRKNAAALAA